MCNSVCFRRGIAGAAVLFFLPVLSPSALATDAGYVCPFIGAVVVFEDPGSLLFTRTGNVTALEGKGVASPSGFAEEA